MSWQDDFWPIEFRDGDTIIRRMRNGGFAPNGTDIPVPAVIFLLTSGEVIDHVRIELVRVSDPRRIVR